MNLYTHAARLVALASLDDGSQPLSGTVVEANLVTATPQIGGGSAPSVARSEHCHAHPDLPDVQRQPWSELRGP